MRTTQTTEEMYSEASEEQKGNSNPITEEQALRAKVITSSVCKKDGVFSKKDIPMYLFVEIPNQQEADAAFSFIEDNSKGGPIPNNNIEYGFNINTSTHGIMEGSEVKSERPGNPSKDANIGVPSRIHHSHPSGVNSDRARWQQPLSKQDIENCSYGLEKFVWAMRLKILYKYDINGVKATIPFSIYGR